VIKWSLTIKQFIRSSNTKPYEIFDTARFKSRNGERFKLLYVADKQLIYTYGGDNIPNLDPTAFIEGGDNVGDIEACFKKSFYIYTAFKVVDVTDKLYDLAVEHTVGTESDFNIEKDNDFKIDAIIEKNMEVSEGDIIFYRLKEINLPTSSNKPTNTKLYIKYDTDKLKILQASKECDFSKQGLIVCNVKDLTSESNFKYYYKAQVKNGVTGTINSSVEILPDNDFDMDDSNDHSYATLYIQ